MIKTLYAKVKIVYTVFCDYPSRKGTIMSKPVKIVSLIVVILLVTGIVFGIAVFSASYTPPPEKTGIVVDKTLVEAPGTMLTVNGTPVSFEDYRYYYISNKNQFIANNYDESYFESDYDGAKAKALKDQTEQNITMFRALLDYAAANNITLTDEEKAEITTALADQKAQEGDGFAELLVQNGYTDEAMYIRLSEEQRLASKAYNAMLEEYKGDAEKELKDTMLTAKHILLMFDSEAEDPEQNEKDVLEASEAMYKEITESDDPAKTFDEMMNEYSMDTGLEANPDGYTFGPGEMVPEFENGTKALKEGEISEPIRSDWGYHIIMRLPLDETQMESQISNKANTILQEKLTETMDSMEVVPGEYYTDVTPSSIQ